MEKLREVCVLFVILWCLVQVEYSHQQFTVCVITNLPKGKRTKDMMSKRKSLTELATLSEKRKKQFTPKMESEMHSYRHYKKNDQELPETDFESFSNYKDY